MPYNLLLQCLPAQFAVFNCFNAKQIYHLVKAVVTLVEPHTLFVLEDEPSNIVTGISILLRTSNHDYLNSPACFPIKYLCISKAFSPIRFNLSKVFL